MDFLTWSSIVSTAISVALNVWQYHSAKLKEEAAARTCSAVWFSLTGIRGCVKNYWGFPKKEHELGEALVAAEKTLQDIDTQAAHARAVVDEVIARLGFHNPRANPYGDGLSNSGIQPAR